MRRPSLESAWLSYSKSSADDPLPPGLVPHRQSELRNVAERLLEDDWAVEDGDHTETRDDSEEDIGDGLQQSDGVVSRTQCRKHLERLVLYQPHGALVPYKKLPICRLFVQFFSVSARLHTLLEISNHALVALKGTCARLRGLPQSSLQDPALLRFALFRAMPVLRTSDAEPLLRLLTGEEYLGRHVHQDVLEASYKTLLRPTYDNPNPWTWTQERAREQLMTLQELDQARQQELLRDLGDLNGATTATIDQLTRYNPQHLHTAFQLAFKFIVELSGTPMWDHEIGRQCSQIMCHWCACQYAGAVCNFTTGPKLTEAFKAFSSNLNMCPWMTRELFNRIQSLFGQAYSKLQPRKYNGETQRPHVLKM